MIKFDLMFEHIYKILVTLEEFEKNAKVSKGIISYS